MDTIEENRLLESKEDSSENLKSGDLKESERLSELFKKYSIEQYFWRNYNNKLRVKSLLLIFGVTLAAIVVAIIFLKIVLPV